MVDPLELGTLGDVGTPSGEPVAQAQARSPRNPDAEREANASLIAAAPDMLHALEKARVAIQTWSPDPREPLEDIDRAIAKAKGQ